MPAVFTVLSIQKAKDLEATSGFKIFGVRFASFLPAGWVHRTELAPSKQLLFRYRSLAAQHGRSEELFFQEYVPHYAQEVAQNPRSYAEAREILHYLQQGTPVYYACYCAEPRHCHRSLVAHIIGRNGFPVAVR